MTRNLLDDTTRQALLGLDPGAAELDTAEMKRADATLARILTADPKVLPLGGPVPPRPRRMRRVALLGAAATVAAVAVVGTELIGGGSPPYASWTATPHQPTTSPADRRGHRLPRVAAGLVRGHPPKRPGQRDPHRAAPGFCSPRRATRRLDPGGAGRQRRTRRFLSSSKTTTAPLPTTPQGSSGYRESLNLRPRDILVSSGGTGGSRNNLMSVLIGFVGTDVTGVTVHTAEHDDVTATVENGHVAAWWPGPRAVSVTDPQLGTTVNATVTYSDGTTEERRLDVGPNPGEWGSPRRVECRGDRALPTRDP